MSLPRFFTKFALISVQPLSSVTLAKNSLQSQIDSPHRAESNSRRNEYRHPPACHRTR